MSTRVILASASPRRRELLAQINVQAIVRPVELDERQLPNEKALVYVQRLAAEKSALCKAIMQTTIPVLAADTAVVIDNQIFGKPKNREHGLAMLHLLSGQTHVVYTAISIRGKLHQQAVSKTEVTFKTLTPTEIEAYWRTGEPGDKAGGYAIQGKGSVFVESINGSYSGVVGLPLFETAQLLAQEGIDLLV